MAVVSTGRVIAHHAAAPYLSESRKLLGGAGGCVVDEAVADVAHRLNVGLVALDLGANAADVDIDGARAAVVVVAPDPVEEGSRVNGLPGLDARKRSSSYSL